MSDIDEMFKTFDEKKRKEQDEIDKNKQNLQRLQEKAYKILDEIVLPVIKDLSVVIQQKGHKADFKRAYGYVEFNFAPSSNPHFSTMKFHHRGGDSIAFIQIVNKKENSNFRKPDDDYPSTVVPPDVNQEWVRSRTLDFIKLVLETN